MSMVMKNAWTALALVAIATVTTQAQAQNADGTIVATGRRLADSEHPTILVSYADLNLRNDAGANRLGSRVRNAARQVCNVEDLQIPTLAVQSRACYRTTLDRAKQDVAFAIERARGAPQMANNDAGTLIVRRQ
ncbi:UrcA family protein [Sphingomonas sp. KC8]|uniref:UrcA family protein n=1 Tax=Sphingomonas sp. KC8 TaxID=1030157 RepID=UPI0009FC395A|nr:UrcA family protein [Sphingomonas sp. KC8]ARS27529.1 hypothetical protein KC8_09520 [Sphingomonas sp. KC8]